MAKLNTSNKCLGELVETWLTFPEVAELLDVKITAVHRLASEGKLIFVALGEEKIKSVPADFFIDGQLVDSLPGTLTVLCDAGFSSAEMIEWFFKEDPSLPGTPMEALRAGRKTEIRRRAAAFAW